MVDISVLTMVYKPTYNWGGHNLVDDCPSFIAPWIGEGSQPWVPKGTQYGVKSDTHHCLDVLGYPMVSPNVARAFFWRIKGLWRSCDNPDWLAILGANNIIQSGFSQRVLSGLLFVSPINIIIIVVMILWWYWLGDSHPNWYSVVLR